MSGQWLVLTSLAYLAVVTPSVNSVAGCICPSSNPSPSTMGGYGAPYSPRMGFLTKVIFSEQLPVVKYLSEVIQLRFRRFCAAKPRFAQSRLVSTARSGHTLGNWNVEAAIHGFAHQSESISRIESACLRVFSHGRPLQLKLIDSWVVAMPFKGEQLRVPFSELGFRFS